MSILAVEDALDLRRAVLAGGTLTEAGEAEASGVFLEIEMPVRRSD